MSSSKTTYLNRFIFSLSFFFILCSCSTQSEKSAEQELCTSLVCRNLTWTDKFKHCGTFIHICGEYTETAIVNQYSLQGFAFQYDPETSNSSTYIADRDAFLNRDMEDVTHQLIHPPDNMDSHEFIELIREHAKRYKAIAYWPYGPNSNSAADYPLYKSGARTEKIKGALGLHHYHKDSELDEIKNNAISLFYEYASNKSKELIKQIKSQTIDYGAFRSLKIDDDKLTTINRLQELKAFYVSTEDYSQNSMIDLRESNNASQNILLASNTWNVTYDDNGKTFWFLQLVFEQNKLEEINIKSSNLELP